MTGIRYTEEFKLEALKQITERGHSVNEVEKRLTFIHKAFILASGICHSFSYLGTTQHPSLVLGRFLQTQHQL